jgi:hypothetical protein
VRHELAGELTLEEAEETLLVGADLMQVDVREAGAGELLDPRLPELRVGAADDVLHDLFLGDEGCEGLEILRQR